MNYHHLHMWSIPRVTTFHLVPMVSTLVLNLYYYPNGLAVRKLLTRLYTAYLCTAHCVLYTVYTAYLCTVHYVHCVNVYCTLYTLHTSVQYTVYTAYLCTVRDCVHCVLVYSKESQKIPILNLCETSLKHPQIMVDTPSKLSWNILVTCLKKTKP